MKTSNFTLYVTILMMGAVMTAAGQPARGEKNGNHANNNRSEIKSDKKDPVQGDRNIRYNGSSGDRVRAHQEMKVNENLSGREQDTRHESQVRETENRNKDQKSSKVTDQRETGRRSYSSHRDRGASGNNKDSHPGAVRQNRNDHGKQGVYADNRNYKENPASNHREYSFNVWDRRDYSRHEWEHRKYNWNERNWNFSNYYHKGHVPYYFRNNHNYWFYPAYGHILRSFRHDPYLFHSGRIPYYFLDGFIYRYYNGIGYVWIEDPYDIWFNELPYDAVAVRIGGRIYYRLGNAYFETGPLGFHLAIVPDRYYDHYNDRGVSFEISARF